MDLNQIEKEWKKCHKSQEGVLNIGFLGLIMCRGQPLVVSRTGEEWHLELWRRVDEVRHPQGFCPQQGDEALWWLGQEYLLSMPGVGAEVSISAVTVYTCIQRIYYYFCIYTKKHYNTKTIVQCNKMLCNRITLVQTPPTGSRKTCLPLKVI